MPRKSEKVKPGVRKYGKKSNYTPEILQEAIEKIKSGAISRVGAAKLYKIPPVTLFYKLKEKHDKNMGRPKIFTDEEENTFVSHLLMMADLGIPCKRHPEIKEKVGHKIPRKRAQVNREQIDEFFCNIKEEIEGVAPNNIYNMDETGFHDDPGQKKLLFHRDCRNPEIVKNSSKSCYTVIFCGNANGDMMPPFFVFKGKKLWSDWLFQAPSGSRMSVSQSGWIDQSIFEDWLENHFLPYVDKDDGKKILLCDNLSAHISPKALRLCEAHNVAFICLIPNSTHLLQPLDVGYFSPLKTAWRKVLDSYRNTSRGKKVLALPKSLFAQLIKITLENIKVTSAENMKAGFRSCGLYPFSPQTVLSKLPTYTSQTEVRESVAESFVNFIEEVRQSDLNVVGKARKFQLPVTAGKSVSAEEVEEYQKNREKENKGKPVTEGKKRGRPKGSTNKGKVNKKAKVSEQEASNSAQNVDSANNGIESELQKTERRDQVVCAEIHQYESRIKESKNQEDISINLDTEKSHDINKLHAPVITETVEEYPLTEDHFLELGDEITIEPHSSPDVVEDFIVHLDDTLIKAANQTSNQNDNQPLEGSYCVFNVEGSLFPGRITKITDCQITLSLPQKKISGGWTWPSKIYIHQIDKKEIIHMLNDDQIIRSGSKFKINDDILFMEWGE
ncbi:unnamed protein product [Arctia plantaginis]|uniref:DDE-1 domain-containing protein n=2 Tax=Arctia plantaginis TaxID=874455 RepID=A0A8S1AVR8_ARCPL|nr:unnamed protein product [Arctia plantaginis]